MENAVKQGIDFIRNVSRRMDICVDSNGPIILMENSIYKSNYKSAKNRGVRIRLLTEITKENINYCKLLLPIVDEIRHLEGLKGSLCVSDIEFIGSTTWEKKELLNPIIYSNQPEVIVQQQYVFETLWKKSDTFVHKLKEIEDGITPEVLEIKNDPSDTQVSINKLLKSSQQEVLVIMSTSNAFHRQVKEGSFDILTDIVNHKPWMNVKILTPKDDKIVKLLTTLSQSNISIRFIEPLSKVSILIVDRKYSLVAETKDDAKEKITDAIGFVTYSNSPPTVLSYVAIFDTFWKQTEIYNQLKRAHEKLEIHDKMQKDFIDLVAHELRTPLTPIIGLTEYVKNKTKNKRYRELLNRVVIDAKKLSELNEKIIDVTKIESNLFKINREIFSLNFLLNQIIECMRVSHKDFVKKLDFELIDSDNDYMVYADKLRLRQVISNLIENSVKSISEKETNQGCVSISMKEILIEHNKCKLTDDGYSKITNNPSKMISISVTDTGKGIDKAIQNRLFTKFTSKSYQGTGLGLYITRNIIEMHGGKIWIEKNEKEVGTTISFSLPINYE